jgi:hypothetical protein
MTSATRAVANCEWSVGTESRSALFAVLLPQSPGLGWMTAKRDCISATHSGPLENELLRAVFAHDTTMKFSLPRSSKKVPLEKMK